MQPSPVTLWRPPAEAHLTYWKPLGSTAFSLLTFVYLAHGPLRTSPRLVCSGRSSSELLLKGVALALPMVTLWTPLTYLISPIWVQNIPETWNSGVSQRALWGKQDWRKHSCKSSLCSAADSLRAELVLTDSDGDITRNINKDEKWWWST